MADDFTILSRLTRFSKRQSRFCRDAAYPPLSALLGVAANSGRFVATARGFGKSAPPFREFLAFSKLALRRDRRRARHRGYRLTLLKNCSTRKKGVSDLPAWEVRSEAAGPRTRQARHLGSPANFDRAASAGGGPWQADRAIPIRQLRPNTTHTTDRFPHIGQIPFGYPDVSRFRRLNCDSDHQHNGCHGRGWGTEVSNLK